MNRLLNLKADTVSLPVGRTACGCGAILLALLQLFDLDNPEPRASGRRDTRAHGFTHLGLDFPEPLLVASLNGTNALTKLQPSGDSDAHDRVRS
jgi:hypothetical protein